MGAGNWEPPNRLASFGFDCELGVAVETLVHDELKVFNDGHLPRLF